MSILDNTFDDMKAAFYAGTHTTDHGLEWVTPQGRGYGTVYWYTEGFQIRMRAHRVAWILENGPIPDGYVIDHDPACPKSCVTASHFLCLTQSEHNKLGWERGEMLGGITTRDVILREGNIYDWQEQRTCPECREDFMMVFIKQIYCSKSCYQTFKERRRAKKRYPRPESKICEWCNEEFSPKRIDTRFCSRKCIDNNSNERRR